MHHHRAFTLIEVLIVIVIIAILAALILPVFARSKVEAMKTVSKSNLKQIHTAAILYGQDYDCFDDVPGLGGFPLMPLIDDVRILIPYGATADVLRSPLAAGSPSWEWLTTYTRLPPVPRTHPLYGPGLYGLYEKLQKEQQAYSVIQDKAIEWRRWTNTPAPDLRNVTIPAISLSLSGSVTVIRRPYMGQLEPD